jgi:hypothetical protein
MSRSFRYYASPEEVRSFVEALGYKVADKYDHTRTKVIGFLVPGTTVELSYDLVVGGRVVGYGSISTLEGIGEPDALARGKELYRKLNHRFAKPKNGE